MARGGSGAIGMGVVAVAFGGAAWAFAGSLLGELDHRPIVPLDQAQVGERAWAEGRLDGPEVIRYGPETGRSTPRNPTTVRP